jgi:hypothetical protein
MEQYMENNKGPRRKDDLKREGEAYLLPGRIEAVEREQASAKKRDEEYKERQLDLDGKLVMLTFFLVIVGLLGTLIAVWQSFISERAVNAAFDAAAAAKEGLIAGRKTTEIENRAFINYVNFDARKINDTRVSKALFLELTVHWANSGATPTKFAATRSWIRAINSPVAPLPEGFSFPLRNAEDIRLAANPVDDVNRFSIGPGGRINTPVNVTLEEVDAARKGKTHLYVWGFTVYSDVFADTPRRLTEFCVEMTQIQSDTVDINDTQGSLRWGVEACAPRHNCYDEDCPDYAERIKQYSK